MEEHHNPALTETEERTAGQVSHAVKCQQASISVNNHTPTGALSMHAPCQGWALSLLEALAVGLITLAARAKP